jgi:leucyl aminopeptidase
MKIGIDRREALASSLDIVVAGVLERSEKEDAFPRTLSPDDAASGGLIQAAWKRREIRGKRKEVTVIHRPDGKGRIALVGLGPLASYDVETVRRAAAEALRAFKGKGARTLGFRLSSFTVGGVPADGAAAALTEGAMLGAYEFLRYISTRESTVEDATVFLGEEHIREESSIRKAVDHARTVADAVLWTRDIVNVPADVATPSWLAEEARKLGKDLSVKVTVYDEKQLAEMHCGGLLAVGGGSVHPPRMVVLEYPGGARSGKTVAVVGKGITFDSGGISIKSAPGMSTMKFDKAGACAVLGIVRAAATLKVPPRVVGVMACAENLPGEGAYRPGDVVTSYNGKTIEVLNTDAEGRVVLSDALGFVVDRFKPDVVIDLATLTGACVVALGDNTAGLIATDDGLAQALLDASAKTGEPIWRLPLTDYHRELVKSDVADVRNSTEITPAGALTAAAFLEMFVGRSVPWAHIDIAGPAWTNAGTRKYQPSYQNIGATAFGVRLVTRYLEAAPR